MGKMVNFDEIKESNFITNPGSYTVKIMSHERKKSSKGNEMDVYLLETKDGEKISLRLVTSEDSLFKYRPFIRAVRGLSDTTKLGTVDLDAFPATAVGKKIKIEVVRQPDKINIVTGEKEPNPFLEIKKVSVLVE